MNFLTAWVELRVDDKTVKVKLSQIKKAFTKTAKESEKSFKRMEGAFGRSLGRMLRRLVIWVGGVTAVLKGIKWFAQFEEQLADISTLLDDEFLPLMSRFAEGVKNMAMDFGHATDELNRALYMIISATIPPAQALEVLAAASYAAKAGLASVSEAAYAITGIINAYGMAASKATDVSDSLFVTIKRGQTTFKELAPAIGRVTSIAAQAGVSLEEVSAALSTLTRAGINTNEAVTVLRMAILSLQGSAEISAKSAKKYGITLSAEMLKRKKLIGMVQEMGRLSPDALKDVIREVRARLALSVLIKNQAGFMKDLDLQTNKAGFTQKAFNKQAQTLMFSLRRIGQAIKVVAINLAEAIGPALRDVTDRMTNFLRENKNEIWKWAQIFGTRVAYVKDVFLEFVEYLRTDWRGALSMVFSIVLELTKGFMNALIVLVREGALKVADAFVDSFATKIARGIAGVVQKIDQLVMGAGYTKWAKEMGAMKPEHFKTTPFKIDSGAGKELKQIAEETARNIKSISDKHGFDLADSKEKANNRLLAINKEYQTRAAMDEMIAADLELANLNSQLEEQEEVVVQSTENILSRMLGRIKKYGAAWALEGEKRWTDFAEAIKSPMESAFEKMIFEGEKFGATMANIARAVVMEFIKIQFIRPFVGMMSAGVGGMYSAPVAHEGGEVGNISSRRMVPISVFSGAPKYHGLRQGEQAIIAEKGETISRGEPAGNTFNITLQAIDTQSGIAFLAKNKRMIADLGRTTSKENHPNRRGG